MTCLYFSYPVYVLIITISLSWRYDYRASFTTALPIDFQRSQIDEPKKNSLRHTRSVSDEKYIGDDFKNDKNTKEVNEEDLSSDTKHINDVEKPNVQNNRLESAEIKENQEDISNKKDEEKNISNSNEGIHDPSQLEAPISEGKNGKKSFSGNGESRAAEGASPPNLSFLPPGAQAAIASQNGQATLILGAFQIIMMPMPSVKDGIPGLKPPVPGVGNGIGGG